MSTVVTLHAGHDVAYFTSGQDRGGCAGAMSYYTAAGEPAGEWAGKGAAALGLAGQVDPRVIGRLYQHNIGPGGELLVTRRRSQAAGDREQAAVTAYLAAHPYASATKLAEVRAAEHGQDPHQVPYFDLTVSAVKSISVLHASYRVCARQARDRGQDDQAAAFDARAEELEDALMDSAREAVSWLDRHAAYTRTGHHSARTGEWRDGGGLVASLFLHHLSRDGDPQLHVHVAIWNRIQRGDGADDTWRTLDSRSLHSQRLGVAPVADRVLEARLSALGYVMVPRADSNGAEVGGVSQDVMDLFSSRAVAVTGEPNASPASTRRCTVSRRPGARCGCCTSRPGRTPAAPKPRPAAPWPGRPARPSPPRRSGSPPGKPRPCTARCAPCRRCTRKWPSTPRRAPGVHRRCWMMRPNALPRGSRWPRCKPITRSGRWPSSGSRCTARSRCCPPAPTAKL